MLDYKTPRSFSVGALTYTIRWVLDESPDLSWLTQDYACKRNCGHKPKASEHVSAALNAKYQAQDCERLAAYHRDEWCMIACLVAVSVENLGHWAKAPEVGHAALFGIESDNSSSYLEQVEGELMIEARNDAKHTKLALGRIADL